MQVKSGSQLQRPVGPGRTLRRGWSQQRLWSIFLCAALSAPWLLIVGLKGPGRSDRTTPALTDPKRLVGSAAANDSPVVAGQPLLLDLNEVPHQQLTLLPGVGPALAERIIRYRRERGRFETLEELRRVDGIGPVLTDQLSGYLYVDPPLSARPANAQSQ